MARVSIENLYRVVCRCERYLGCSRPAITDSSASPLFLTFTSAYQEAVRMGWSKFPLCCPDCAKEEGS